MNRSIYISALVAAAVMLAAVPFMAVTAQPCHPLPMSPVMALELLRTPADLERILGGHLDECRLALGPQLEKSTLVDTFLYIPAYTAFFVLFARAAGKQTRMIALAAMGLAVASALADVGENVAMLQLISPVNRPEDWLPLLIFSTNFKWIGLALMTTLCGWMVARRGGLWMIALPLCVVPIGTSLWALADPNAAGQYLLPGMTVASVCLLLVAIWGAVRGDREAAAPTLSA